MICFWCFLSFFFFYVGATNVCLTFECFSIKKEDYSIKVIDTRYIIQQNSFSSVVFGFFLFCFFPYISHVFIFFSPSKLSLHNIDVREIIQCKIVYQQPKVGFSSFMINFCLFCLSSFLKYNPLPPYFIFKFLSIKIKVIQ